VSRIENRAPGRTRIGLLPDKAGPRAAAPPVPVLAVTIALSLLVGTMVFASGAHLLHFDAKAHLLVARRVLDSLTPGWTQLGAVWLPLPHILNVLPAQSDFLYRSGLFASVLGAVFFVGGVVALGYAAARGTGDPRAGAVAMAVPVLNPGWLYLLATPMTEPLFLGLVGALALFVVRWRTERRESDLWAAALIASLASLVRYEAWPIVAAATVVACLPDGAWPPRAAFTRWAPVLLGVGLVAPVLLFGLHTWIATERAFYVIDDGNLTEERGNLTRAITLLADGIVEAFGMPLALMSVAALALIVVRRRDPVLAMAVACTGPAVVTFTAYFAGHPTKTRYALLLAPAFGLALAAVTRGRRVGQLGVLALASLQLVEAPPILPVLREATRDRAAVATRRPFVDTFPLRYQGGHLLASMGSTAPVLFEIHLPLREVVHEGNGHYWANGVVDPGRFVSWVLIADGDVLDQVRNYRRAFPEGFVPVWRGASLTLYERKGGPAPR
jgi:hypothetical protein